MCLASEQEGQQQMVTVVEIAVTHRAGSKLPVVNSSHLIEAGVLYMQVHSPGLGQHLGQLVPGHAVPGHHQLHDGAACGIHRAQHHVQGTGLRHVP